MFENLKPKTRVFLTGHTGFKGSWLSLLLKKMEFKVYGFALSPDAEALFNHLDKTKFDQSTFGDIRDKQLLKESLLKAQPEIVIHFAAQPLVRLSYEKPVETFEVNVQGTLNLLEAANDCSSVRVILIITTDKVYKNLNMGTRFSEDDCLEGADPYSASKVATEAVAIAWQKLNTISTGPKVFVARAGNVIGGGDLSVDRLIPDLVRSLKTKGPLLVRNPLATRPWQHVLDPLFGYLEYVDQALERAVPPALNFGPSDSSISVKEVLDIAQDHFDIEIELENIETSLLPEAQKLDLNSDLAGEVLGWSPRWTQVEAINRTFEWWKKSLNKSMNPRELCEVDIETYLSI